MSTVDNDKVKYREITRFSLSSERYTFYDDSNIALNNSLDAILRLSFWIFFWSVILLRRVALYHLSYKNQIIYFYLSLIVFCLKEDKDSLI